GPAYEPFIVEKDPNQPDFSLPELSLSAEVPTLRLDRRRTLLSAVERAARLAEGSEMPGRWDAVRQKGFELLRSDRLRTSLDLSREKPELRERYGRTTFGQSLILARRLIEGGMPCVTVNWARFGNWDHHGKIFPSLKKDMLPHLDQTISALLQDLSDRGLLDHTLVVMTGEFRRSPKIN